MMVEVTDADREAAASVAVLAEMRELILYGRADHHAEPWAIHRQRGKLEGARELAESINLRHEVARGTDLVEICRNLSGEMRALGDTLLLWVNEDDLHALEIARIAALDPAKIVGEG